MTDDDYTTVPAGTYRCRITDVRPRKTRSGDTVWALSLTVAEGEYQGRLAVWDSLVFSPRGLARVRLVSKALGVQTPTQPDVRECQEHWIGREALVTVRPAEYAGPEGDIIRRNEVPYAGWKEIT